MKRDFQISFLKSRGLKPSHRLVDVGCGTLRGGVPLIDYLDAGNYTGIEARADVLEEGRDELRRARLESKSPTLIVAADLGQVSLDQRFDIAWAFSVLIHMDDEALAGCLSFVAAHLAPGGRFFANVNLGQRPDGQWQQFPIVWRTADFYREQAAVHALKMRAVGRLGELGHISGSKVQDRAVMLKFSLADR